MARFLTDINFPLPIVRRLRRLGHDVVTLQELQGTSRPQVTLSDGEVLRLSAEKGRAVLTLDFDFVAVHKGQRGHKGIVICTADDDGKRQAKSIDATVKANLPLNGKLLFVSSRKQ